MDFTRCPACHVGPLTFTASAGVAPFHCTSCAAAFAMFRGTPLLLSFGPADAQTVVEMLCMERYPNLPPVTKRGQDAFSYLIERWSGKSTGAHQVQAYENARSIEGALTLAMLSVVPVQGGRVLDVGAGSGSDSCFLKSLGAKEVIALEPNFLLLARGQDLFPDLTWLGGSAVALPVATECMDLVTANASLHHHLDAEVSLDEMLRVLKPGGWLVTVGDSVKGSSSEEVTVDYQQWDVHPSVLMGINEQILRMDVLLKRIIQHGDAVRGEVFLREGNTGEWQVWSLEEALAIIAERPRIWGVMGMRVQKLRSLQTPDYRTTQPTVATAALAQSVLEQTDSGIGYSLLSQMLAAEDLRSTAPLTEVSRLLQLNGWRWPVQGAAGRLAYRRARLFMPATPAARSLQLEFGLPVVDTTPEATVSLSIDGKTLYEATVCRGQQYHWSLPVSGVPQACAVTLELQTVPDAAGAGYVTANKHLCISRMEFSTQEATGSKAMLPMTRTLIPVLLEHLPAEVSFALVLGGKVEQGLDAVGLLRQHGCHFRCSVAAAHQPSYAWLHLQHTTAVAKEQPTLFSAMTLAQARQQAEELHLQQAWWLHQSILYDLKQKDHFASQLSPAPNPAEADLRRQLEKQQLKLQVSQEKITSLRTRLEKTKAETTKRKKWWQLL